MQSLHSLGMRGATRPISLRLAPCHIERLKGRDGFAPTSYAKNLFVPLTRIACSSGGSTAGPSHCRTYVARVVWFGLANAEDKTKTASSPTRPKRVGLSCGSFSQVFQRTGAFTSSNLVVTANSAIFRPMSAPASVEKR